jgi:hypothetical protein
MGVKESETNVSNKLGCGTFTGAFMIQCLDAIGCRVLQIKEND